MITNLDIIVKLAIEEIHRSECKYGLESNHINLAGLIVKEANEVFSGTEKIAIEGFSEYRKWAIAHNIIQTIAACLKYLEFLETKDFDINNFNMEKCNENKTKTTE